MTASVASVDEALFAASFLRPVTPAPTSIVRGEAATNPTTAPAAGPTPRFSARVLLAEDNPLNQRVSTAMLERRTSKGDIQDARPNTARMKSDSARREGWASPPSP